LNKPLGSELDFEHLGKPLGSELDFEHLYTKEENRPKIFFTTEYTKGIKNVVCEKPKLCTTEDTESTEKTKNNTRTVRVKNQNQN
jgi:hypothetical protein